MIAQHIKVREQRLHVTPRGNLPGVTTIAKASEPDITEKIIASFTAKKPHVDHIARGNIVEAAIDRYLDTGVAAIEPQYRPWLDSVIPMLDTVTRIDGRQEQIVGELYGLPYAGSYDFRGEVNDNDGRKRVVIDWKAPNSRRTRSSAQCTSYLCQIAAYWHAIGRDEIDEAWLVFALPKTKKPHIMRLLPYDPKHGDYATMLALFGNWLIQWYDRFEEIVL